MTLARCKENFLEALADETSRVVALSGKWGTGKSYLWKEVQAASTNDVVKGAIYASLFGASSISELKIKIAQQLLPKLDAGGVASESIKSTFVAVKKVLKGFHSGFAALDELAIIATPLMLKGRFIVIDDIERKHEKLSIDEVLGFIDDCVQNLGCRILLILNSDQLHDFELWNLFREKVIDEELRLETSPSEAFDIAASLTPTVFADELKQAVEACRVINIRIIRKIIRVVNRLLTNRGELPPHTLARVIPSITLLSAIHYKGLDDGPDFDFVLGFENFLITRALRDKKEREEESPKEKARERWRLLLDKLGIQSTDGFEALVVDYLKSGLIDIGAVGAIIDRYVAEGQQLAARTRAHDFFERSIWHPDIPEGQLLKELKAMLPDIGLIDMATVTSLHRQASNLTGGTEIASELIEGWVSAFRARHPLGQGLNLDPDYDYFRRSLHPAIEAEIRALLAHQQSTTTLLEVCRRFSEDQSWGSREKSLMRSITPTEYEAAITSATGHDLKLILLQSMDFLKNRNGYEDSFGSGIESFVIACRAIAHRQPNSRLARLVRDLFSDAGMGSMLPLPAIAVLSGPQESAKGLSPE